MPSPDYRTKGWLGRENARPGTTDWQVNRFEHSDKGDWIEGYLGTTSAQIGDKLALHVSTLSPTWNVDVYRIGFYGGKRGRLVWSSANQVGVVQPPAVEDAATGMVEAKWPVSIRIDVTDQWAPGAYLLKLHSSGHSTHYIPLTIRDDGSTSDLMVIEAVATWQAYNDWGACSLYACLIDKSRRRAVKVSFDRPYFHAYGLGAADFIGSELPFIAFLEESGVDVTYVTDVDLDADPARTLRHKGVLSIGHDEYYSTMMRRALEHARNRGVNLAFFGANAVYRHIRFEPSSDGVERRVIVNYRNSPDPVLDPSENTTEWRHAPLNEPEARLIGIQYSCAPMKADLHIDVPDHWIFAGTGVTKGQVFANLMGNEYDHQVKDSPANLIILGEAPVHCQGRDGTAHQSYYEAPSGAGVFASGTLWWGCALDRCKGSNAVDFVRQTTANLLAVFAQAPAVRVAKPTAAAPAPVPKINA